MGDGERRNGQCNAEPSYPKFVSWRHIQVQHLKMDMAEQSWTLTASLTSWCWRKTQQLAPPKPGSCRNPQICSSLSSKGVPTDLTKEPTPCKGLIMNSC